ncbi:MAG: hypothetical protein GXO23_07250 [Crenarchaeota archaeon]|nr:hypothetical protein [Thermoproteota archaeon]
MTAVDDIVNQLGTYIEKNVEILPILIGYIYSMNIDPIIHQISRKLPDIDVVNLKQVLSSVRRLIYSTSMLDVENPLMEDITKIDERKYEICTELQRRYCQKLTQHLKDLEKKVNKIYLKKLAVILRVCERQKILRGALVRISMRPDIVQGWIMGVKDCLKDLGYSVENGLEGVSREGLDAIVERSLPVGYASYNVLIVPSCLEDYCDSIVERYGNVRELFEIR